jgi:hypothetical protein
MCRANSDGHRWCGTSQLHSQNLATVPGFRAARQFIENFSLVSKVAAVSRDYTAQIPVVVHVVYNTSAQDISQARIESQIEVLNKDFNAKNEDLKNVPEVWKSLIGNCNINFFLARRDPNGNATTGVTRTKTNVTAFDRSNGIDQRMMASATGGADPWPSNQYLNFWVCNLGSRLLGFANIPSLNSIAADGVVINTGVFGVSGAATDPYGLGRTAVHEVGHWLNLFHIWGDDNMACSGSDKCDDTPNQAGDNSGTPRFPKISCNNGPNGDMFMNFMDYCYDATTVMFTKGQVERINATLAGPRASLLGSNFSQFLLHTGTALEETDDSFQFLVTDWNGDGRPDLVAIQKSGTTTGKTEIRVLSGASEFKEFILHSETALGETGDDVQFLITPRKGDQPPDLVVVSKNKPGAVSTEIHVLSGSKNYQEIAFQAQTSLHQTDDTFQFALADWNGDGSDDLVVIKKSDTTSKSTEVLVLSGASGYIKPILQTATPLEETDDTYEFLLSDWNGDGKPDLIAIKKTSTDTEFTQVQIFSGQHDFKQTMFKTDTILLNTQKNFEFALVDWDNTGRPDLVAIKKRSTNAGKIELHILSG